MSEKNGFIGPRENEERREKIKRYAEWERENQWLIAQPGDRWLGEFGKGGAIPLRMYL